MMVSAKVVSIGARDRDKGSAKNWRDKTAKHGR